MILTFIIVWVAVGLLSLLFILSQQAALRNIPPLEKRLKHISPARIDSWMAASELFLDTELAESDWDRIASTLIRSGLSDRELDRLYFHEVQPVCRTNLYQVAGVWGTFDRDQMIEVCSKRHYMPESKPTIHFDFTMGGWKRLKTRIRQMRNQLPG